MRSKLVLLITCLLANAFLYAQDPLAVYKKVQESEKRSVFGAIPWEPLGPSFQGGRIETIDCPPDQPNVIYAGFGSGSLWKTINQGLSWTCIFENEATCSIGDVAVAPSDPEILYLGTGENLRATRGYTLHGTGLYKSVDGGNSWDHIGLSDSHHIGRVIVDPNNPQLVFAAVIGHMWSRSKERGLYITRDGGVTWQNALFISDSVGVVDAAWDPVNKIIYAAAWEMIAGKSSGIYRSADFGKKWEKCTDGFPENAGIGRIGLAIAPTNPSIVYACLDNRNSSSVKNGTGMAGLEVYRSEDSGKKWKKVNTGYLDNYSGFGWAFGDIRVSPVDARQVYVLGVHTLFSSDGGKTFSRLSGSVSHLEPSIAASLHLDHHDLWIDPSNPDRLILGNDGGIYISEDKGLNWLHCNNIPTAEVYCLHINDGGQPMAYAGTQDNASVFGPLKLGKPLNGPASWSYVWLDPWSGGDGFATFPDPNDPSVIFYESQNGALNRKNMTTGETTFIQPGTEDGESPMRNSWLTPCFFSRHAVSTIYYGANKIYKSIDRGDNWIRLSPDLCFSADAGRKSRAITALAESPAKAGLIYAGTEKGAVWVSRDDGLNWIEISDGLPVKSVVRICPSEHAETRVYLVMKSVEDDDSSPYLFYSDNNGFDWKSIGSGLPGDRINCLTEDPLLSELVYAGTDRGVFISPDKGRTWTAISRGLPTSSVQELVWAGDDNYLVAGTHGLSLFSCYAAPIRKYFKSVDPASESVLSVRDGYLPGQKDFPGDLDWSRSVESALYWYQPKAGLMTITVTDAKENAIYVIRKDAIAGINSWYWNLVLSFKEDTGLYPVPEYKFPAPGTYKITVQGQGIILRSDLIVR